VLWFRDVRIKMSGIQSTHVPRKRLVIGVRPPTSAASAVRLKEPETMTPPKTQERRLQQASANRSCVGVRG